MLHLLGNVKSQDDYDHWFINGNHLGAGSFGAIFEVISRENGKRVAAVKHVNLAGRNEKIRKLAIQEVTQFDISPKL